MPMPPIRPTGDVSQLLHVPGGTPDRPTAPIYLLELARTASVELSSEPVLCKDFLPGTDLTVSAESGMRTDAVTSSEALAARFRKVLDLVGGTARRVPAQGGWDRAHVAFGLVRWWPASRRDVACRSLGPFKMVIDCTTGRVQFNDV